jgi:hypothetical protein
VQMGLLTKEARLGLLHILVGQQPPRNRAIREDPDPPLLAVLQHPPLQGPPVQEGALHLWGGEKWGKGEV